MADVAQGGDRAGEEHRPHAREGVVVRTTQRLGLHVGHAELDVLDPGRLLRGSCDEALGRIDPENGPRYEANRQAFLARLAALGEHPLVGEARGLGLVGAVELVADKASKRAFDPKAGVGPRAVRFAEEEGLIVRFIAGDVVSLCPPLIISPAEIDELFDRLGRALDRTLDWAKRERLL